ncbi:MAG: PspA/IM30 family protein [Trichodesmium sp. St16_bin4-tuft]|nr:PspA/IM30 family protein [Trichodesmium sp. MAG_R01]MDE5069796.1 PspA/IM30 family protein [Trichodesmium sp. St4_bin8_1]MDE5073030.1 PspA/IM30 family protein [Trichodesmium sp. St5_bin8]MDE5078332.1 PspA/IM30 family protein [Trichodesmium sp. St2_bin6]MDE5097147.1 PspA/IM30 family protein [Trichodesmium sp. St16_bin4-tuft]MDE5104065.1 PspA/IM30 family protein [Trichodesmium sp. St19_bin2]
MGLFDRISRIARANVNDMVNKAEDPQKVLEQSILDMQEDLVQLRQAVASAIATQKRTQQQHEQAKDQAQQWYSRAELALKKGDDNLAKEALQRKTTYSDTASTIKISLDSQTAQVETLKRNLTALEGKISEAKAKKDILNARLKAAKTQEQLNNTISSLNTSGAMAAFDRMEEKVFQMEARSQASAELAGAGLEEDFRQLEAHSDVEDELAAMKAKLGGGSVNQSQLPASNQGSAEKPVVDDELEDLRKQLDKM